MPFSFAMDSNLSHRVVVQLLDGVCGLPNSPALDLSCSLAGRDTPDMALEQLLLEPRVSSESLVLSRYLDSVVEPSAPSARMGALAALAYCGRASCLSLYDLPDPVASSSRCRDNDIDSYGSCSSYTNTSRC